MEDLRSALRDHANLVADLVDTLSSELRSGIGPAVDNFVVFFNAINWKEPWLLCLVLFHISFLLIVIISRKNVNFQFGLTIIAFCGIYLAERINTLLREHWQSFSSQNYFDPRGVFISTLWSGPLLLISVVIVANTLLTLCRLIIQWKRAELKHRARVSRGKQD